MISDTNQVSDRETPITIVVNDATLLIDLFEIGLIKEFFELPLEFHTTQLILNELEPNQIQILKVFIDSRKLKVRHLTIAEVESLNTLSENYNAFTREDLSIYLYVKELPKCIILTGDNRLKLEARKRGLEVFEVIWVLEQMVENRLLDKNKALETLRKLVKLKFGFTSKDEYRKALEKWSK